MKRLVAGSSAHKRLEDPMPRPCHIEGCKGEGYYGPELEDDGHVALCWLHSEWVLGHPDEDGLVLIQSEEERKEWRAKRRERTFKQLEDMGIAWAYVGYYGGGDEGFVEPIKLYDYVPEEITPPQAQAVIVDEEDDLGEELAAPIYEQLGSGWWDGEPDVAGHLEWFVKKRRVVFHHSHNNWTTEDPREV